MPVDNSPATHDGAQGGSRAIRIVPMIALCTLALAVAISAARGKTNQIVDGVVVMDYSNYRFYPDAKDCHLRGTPYWLVPNREFHDLAPLPITTDFQHLDRILHAAWRVKVRGNLSRIGRYGFQGKYWRELDVRPVIDATSLNCTSDDIR
jgi:hypothetical protein